MTAGTTKSLLALLLVLVMLVVLYPVNVRAVNLGESQGISDAVQDDSEEPGEPDEDTITDINTLTACLGVLEGYAEEYATTHTGSDPVDLALNYIRTGVERYNSSAWAILAGEEDTDFRDYVAQRDAAAGTTAYRMKKLGTGMTALNGDTVDMGHTFGCMNLTYYARIHDTTDASRIAHADLSGWAGDLCDLVTQTKAHGVSGTQDEMIADILANYLASHTNEKDSFGEKDMFGDLDAFAIINSLPDGSKKLTSAVCDWMTAELTLRARAEFFLKNRFPGVGKQAALREAVLKAYQGNINIVTLEADRGITSEDAALRTACCYAFADYIIALTGEIEVDPPVTPDDPEPEENEYYSVFSSTRSTLAPGLTQEIKRAITRDDKQIAFYVATIDITRDDLDIHANYSNNDGSVWAMSRVTDQVAAAVEAHKDVENYNAVLSTNADFYNMTTGQPSGALVIEGRTYQAARGHNFFAILNDGTPVIGKSSEWAGIADQVRDAVGAGEIIVRDGEPIYSGSTNYMNSRAPRTCVGIRADGKIVLMALDGRQDPFSAGGSMAEIATIMSEAGCVTAVNLDGGGSTTYVAKEEGSDVMAVINRPSDGYERSVSSSLIVVSTAFVSNEFDHAVIKSEADYLTIDTQMRFTAVGVSVSGNSAEIPANAEWQLSNPYIGQIDADGIFTAWDYGDAEVQLVADGTVLGSKDVHVVAADTISFAKKSLIAIYDTPLALPVLATYDGNQVKLNENDVDFTLTVSNAGSFDGFNFTANGQSGIRTVTIIAELVDNPMGAESASIDVMIYSQDEAIFNFDTAMGGNALLSWNRTVSNSTTTDNIYYHVVDPEQPMVAEYTLGLDMREMEVPAKLKDIINLLPGGDNVDATPWTFLLQLAQRVSDLTEVSVELRVDPNVDVDFSELRIVSPYFQFTDASFDEQTRVLTAHFNWVRVFSKIDQATANPICILTGLKFTPRDDANWSSDDWLNVNLTGEVFYDIYLVSNTVYGLAQQEYYQQNYGLYPFVNPNYIRPDTNQPECGAHFFDSATTFEDSYSLDRKIKQGWVTHDDGTSYFVDGEMLTGIQYLPDEKGTDAMYYYDLGDDGLLRGKANGLITYNGNLYYAVLGEAKSGWRVVSDTGEDQYCYFDAANGGAAVDGEQTIRGYHYLFVDHILVRGEWVADENGRRYMWAGSFMKNRWFSVDDALYFARPNCYVAVGPSTRPAPNAGYDQEEQSNMYLFDTDGRWMEEFSGIYTASDGSRYFVENGIVRQHGGLILYNGDYYYINSQNKLVTDMDYYVSNTNGLLPSGTYHFGPDSKLVLNDQPEDPTPDPEQKNGLIEENGQLYYYVNGVKTHAGLIYWEGDYYYIKSNCTAVRDCDYFVANTNGLMPAATHHFDANGKMTDPPGGTGGGTTPEEPKNGIVEENGQLYYYVDGVKTHAGLVQWEGNYYYIKSNCTAVRDCNYFVSNTNGLMPVGTYHFDADGKMTDAPGSTTPEEPKNGIVEENGQLYYYVDGVKTHAGLVQWEGNYYYIKSNCTAVRDCDYFVSNTNGLMPAGTHHFDTDGKMTDAPGGGTTPEEPKNGIVEENGQLYYYVDGVKTHAGLVQWEGNYYYIKSNCTAVRDCDYFVSNTNGLLPVGWYHFNPDGTMAQ